MILYKFLQKEYLGTCCRTCINQQLKVDLQPKDCEYLYYPYPCKICGEQKNIVSSIRIISRYKLLSGKKGRPTC